MTRFLLLLLYLLCTGVAQAQSDGLSAGLSNEAWESIGRLGLVVVGLYVLCRFVLSAIQQLLNYLLKKELLTAAAPESVMAQLLPRPEDEDQTARNSAFKWTVLLSSLGVGLLLCQWSLPLGLHSAVILCFSIALGFLGYFLFMRRQIK